MQLSNAYSSQLKNIKQPSGLNSDSLVFAYPIMIDDSLRQYSGLLRDFLTIQFITQIKISNVLNLTSSATKINYQTTNKEYINPAEEVAKSLQILSDPNRTLSYAYLNRENKPITNNGYSLNDAYSTQEKLNRYKGFIIDQVKSNPTYTQLNPIVSTITVENLIDIPLIVGTKQYFVPNSVLFWILFISSGYAGEGSVNPLSLNNQASLDAIKNIMRKITPNNYMRYFGNSNLTKIGKDEVVPSHRVHQLLDKTEDDLDKTIKYFKRVLNPSDWSSESGIKVDNTLDLQMSNIFNNTMAAKNSITQKANNLFAGILSSQFQPIIYSVAKILVTNDEIEISKHINDLANRVLTNANTFFSSTLDGIVTSHYDDRQKKDDDGESVYDSHEEHFKMVALQQKLQLNKAICKTIASIPVEKLLNDASQTQFLISSSSPAQFANFTDKLTNVATQIGPFINSLENMVHKLSMSPGNLEAGKDNSKLPEVDVQLSQYRKGISSLFLYDPKKINETMKVSDSGILDKFTRPQNPNDNEELIGYVVGEKVRRLLLGVGNGEKIIKDYARAMSDLLYFISLYVFISYLCEYSTEVQKQSEVQIRDALDFPNYCLVIPSSVIEKLYFALASAGFANQKKVYQSKVGNRGQVEEDQASTLNRLDMSKFKLNEKYIMNMIRNLNSRLNIPNLMVVDSKSGSVYYKFMFNSSSQIGQMPFSTMKTFIDHQKDVFQVY